MLRTLNRFGYIPETEEIVQAPKWNHELDFKTPATAVPKKRLLRANAETADVAKTEDTPTAPADVSNPTESTSLAQPQAMPEDSSAVFANVPPPNQVESIPSETRSFTRNTASPTEPGVLTQPQIMPESSEGFLAANAPPPNEVESLASMQSGSLPTRSLIRPSESASMAQPQANSSSFFGFVPPNEVESMPESTAIQMPTGANGSTATQMPNFPSSEQDVARGFNKWLVDNNISPEQTDAERRSINANQNITALTNASNGQTAKYEGANQTYDISQVPEGEMNAIDRGSNPQRIGEDPYAKPQLSDTQQAMADIRDYREQPLLRQKSFFRRLGSGIKNGIMRWAEAGAEGGLGGLIGAIGSGSLISAFSPNADREMRKERGMKKLFEKYNEARGLETAENEQTNEFAKTQKNVLDAQNAGLTGEKSLQDLRLGQVKYVDEIEQAKQRKAEPYLKTAMVKGYLDPEQIRHLKTVYGLDVTDPNNRRFEEFVGPDGKRRIRMVNSPEYVVNTSVPIDESEILRENTIGGDTFKVKDSQGITAKVGIEQANTNRQIARENRIEDRDYKEGDDQRKFEQDRQEKIIAAKASYDKANGTRTQLLTDRANAIKDGLDTKEIDANIAKAVGEMNSAAAEEKNWKNQKYQSSTAKPKEGSYEEAKALVRKKNPTWTDAQVEAAINKHKK